MKNVIFTLLILIGCVAFLLGGFDWMMRGGDVIPALLGLALMLGGLAGVGGFAEDV